MIFAPEFVELVLAGRKTQTRRRAEGRPCAYQAGRDYAVQPGRGRRAVGRIRIVSVNPEPVAEIAAADATAEGFSGPAEFLAWWTDRYGTTAGRCWRIEFVLIEGP